MKGGSQLSGVLMLAGAAALAWAFFTGRLDGVIQQATGRVKTAAGGNS